MDNNSLILGFLLCCILVTASNSYMIYEEKQSMDNKVVNHNTTKIRGITSISIVDLTRISEKLNRKEAEKKKFMTKRVQPKKRSRPKQSPPPNCVATWASCKPPSHPCCDFCAFCHCRLFRTVCYCHMGNPDC